ncbi:hypothetical protein [Noviherbaspirillum pedocola]|uniref:Uncharacterized protein n=1 Tax=Noviherbaspirillum pedocola TaxID=2801341 RepID=A0A934SYF1_9BURK|nr:hypothetical protein [Noviherbaspirillum pedocola]MBK4737883.1 hypothetical protein [Noviherbaspirillum pedocola]
MPLTVVFKDPIVLPSVFRLPASFTAKNSGRISIYAIGRDKERSVSIARIARPGLAIVPEFFSVYVWTDTRGEVCAGDFATGKETRDFAEQIAAKTKHPIVPTNTLVLYSPVEQGYWHNKEGWIDNPLHATLYDSYDLTPATIAALQASTPGAVAVSLFEAEIKEPALSPESSVCACAAAHA